MKKQIIAMGGGGFSMEPENPLLDLYVLKQSKKAKPSICFVPTASGDAEGYIQRFYSSFEKYNCFPTHLSLFKPPSTDLEDYVLAKDIIYVGGGNTKNMLSLWKTWGLDVIMKKALDSGVILAGLSAGSICWFEEGVTDSIPGKLSKLNCLGFLPGSHCPHYDGEVNRRPAYQSFIQANEIKNGMAADDGVALHYIDSQLIKVVSSRKTAKAYHVSASEYGVVEETIDPIFLGS